MLGSDLSSLIRQTHEKARATKSVLSPLQWVLGIAAVPSTVMLTFGNDLAQTVGLYSWGGILSLIGLAYIYFAVKAPDRLQSEGHRENMTLISQPYQDSRGVVIDATAANVAPPSLVQSIPTTEASALTQASGNGT